MVLLVEKYVRDQEEEMKVQPATRQQLPAARSCFPGVVSTRVELKHRVGPESAGS